ncbi:MAG: DUF427 domain-containing protein [Mycobacterium pseudokansasii]|uniref:DUF427 domain-containing protein n=1 Tax=Mycobacterium pseudokansasii TaxID=2341080 RepID=UPI0023EFAF67|nr:DUF427 domain-containing protein [Mycobacterium pseudokansasii]MBY0386937.1 DUF427 domain-containing protein [Mycobacterium pseudokansasii]
MTNRPRRRTATHDRESVWDYPRPPRLETFAGCITVELAGETIAATRHAWRVLETSHPPTYYLPREAFADGVLRQAAGTTWCEWKGKATYYDLMSVVRVAPRAAWSYLEPAVGFEPIAGAVAVMAARVDRCTVDGETVISQPGEFYGGWITSWITGPFKGIAGSMNW